MSREIAAIIRNTMAAQKKLPVRNQTTVAISIAGRKTISKPIRTIMMTPMMIRTKSNAKSAPRLPPMMLHRQELK